jgi:DNA-binding transcriptional LysR family regulator
VREVRDGHPDAEVSVIEVYWNEPREALLEGRVDVVVCRLPLHTDGLDVRILYDEPRALLVSRDHRLAGKEVITLDDIADEPVPRMPDQAWNAFWRIDPRPDGSPAPDGPFIEMLEEKVELIAAGQAVAIVSAGMGGFREDLTTIPLEGVEPSHVVLATRTGERNRLISAFSRAAQAHLTSVIDQQGA